MRTAKIIGVCLLLTVYFAEIAHGEIDYMAVFMEGKKVGHAIETRQVAGEKVRTTEYVDLTMSRVGIPVTVKVTETSVETIKGKALSFSSVQDLGLMAVEMSGTITDQGTVETTSNKYGQVQKQTLEWPSGAVMAEGVRLLGLKHGLKEGTTYTMKLFSPSMGQALDTEIRVGPKKNVDLLGRVVRLTEIVSTTQLPGAGAITTTSYVDDQMRMQKSSMPMMGFQVEMVACTKEFALGDNDVLELVDKMFQSSPRPLGNVGSADSITYHLVPITAGDSLRIPSDDNQKVSTDGRGGVIVTVRPVKPSREATFPYKGDDKEVLEALKPTRYVQSDHKEIIKLARKAVGRTKNTAEAVKKIEAFVAGHIDNKGLSVGYASAVDVARSKQGDCTEFAVLTAALCRAVGIPAQVVVGVAYVKDFAGLEDRFGGHAWVRTYLGGQAGKWSSIDAAFKSAGLRGYDAGHIALAFGNGNPEDFFALVGTMGKFQIDKVTINKSR